MEDDLFKTEDYGLAAYLVLKGMLLAASAPTGTYRRAFLFQDVPERPEWVDEWNTRSGEARLCSMYFGKIQFVKRALKDEEMKIETYGNTQFNS